MDPIAQQGAPTNRAQRRRAFKANRKWLGMTWQQYNDPIQKRQPIISTKDKSRMGYKRRNKIN